MHERTKKVLCDELHNAYGTSHESGTQPETTGSVRYWSIVAMVVNTNGV
jgi:hypothetical protein